MRISAVSQYGTLEKTEQEVVASHGRADAAIEFALCEDGLNRISTRLEYSYGGFCGPIFEESDGYPTFSAARIAGLEALLKHWHKPFESEPQSVHDELRIMREQIESQLRQPTLL